MCVVKLQHKVQPPEENLINVNEVGVSQKTSKCGIVQHSHIYTSILVRGRDQYMQLSTVCTADTVSILFTNWLERLH